MASVTRVDRNPSHLHPTFRAKLETVLEEVAAATGEPWRIVETYRSQARQEYLYSKGRTRPGKKVTWVRSAGWHGAGLAADVVPARSGYKAPHSHFQTLRRIYQRHGLDNPAWSVHDYGHVQLTDPALRQRALAWVRAGFPKQQAPPPAPEIPVLIDGDLIEDADAYLETAHVMAALRPLADALDATILRVDRNVATVVAGREGEETTARIPVVLRGERGFCAVRELAPFCQEIHWDPNSRCVRIRFI